MIEWVTPESHFGAAMIGRVVVAEFRCALDHVVVVYRLGNAGVSRHDTPEQARAHVERYVADWLRRAGLAPQRLAEAA